MTDLLKDSSIDNQQISHVATIETCGKTLLETINHVSWEYPFICTRTDIIGPRLCQNQQLDTRSLETPKEAHPEREAHD
jgi:hypothetical protein